MNSVLVDTNFWIYSFDNKWDIKRMMFELIGKNELMYVPQVVNELKRLGRTDVISWLVSQDVKEVNSARVGADDALLEAATMYGALIATEDKELIKRAKSLGITVVSKGAKASLKIIGNV